MFDIEKTVTVKEKNSARGRPRFCAMQLIALFPVMAISHVKMLKAAAAFAPEQLRP